MEGCIETTTVDDNWTTTVFAKDGVIVAKRVVSVNVSIKVERWYNAEDKCHRDGGQPSEICYRDGKIISLHWYKDGKYHREGDLPVIIHYKNGKITRQYWYKDDKLHREGDQPAVIHYVCGKISKQRWFKDNEYHRECGPNYIKVRSGIISNHWMGVDCREINYLDIPEEQRLSHEFRQAIRRLPLPIGQEIAHHFMEIWPFVQPY